MSAKYEIVTYLRNKLGWYNSYSKKYETKFEKISGKR